SVQKRTQLGHVAAAIRAKRHVRPVLELHFTGAPPQAPRPQAELGAAVPHAALRLCAKATFPEGALNNVIVSPWRCGARATLRRRARERCVRTGRRRG